MSYCEIFSHCSHRFLMRNGKVLRLFCTKTPKVYQRNSIVPVRRFQCGTLSYCELKTKNESNSGGSISSSTSKQIETFADQQLNKHLPRFQRKFDKKSLVVVGHYIPQNIKNWLENESDQIPDQNIVKAFPEPKLLVHNIYSLVSSEKQIKEPLTATSKGETRADKSVWLVKYDVKWPIRKTFSSKSYSKANASRIVALKLLYWLDAERRIDRYHMPILYNREETKTALHHSEELRIAPDLLNQINEFLDSNEEAIRSKIAESNVDGAEKDNIFGDTNRAPHLVISYKKVDPDCRNEILYKRTSEKEYKFPDLPIFEFKDKLIESLESSQALVIKGDTGCGKTTQVPQFIFDHFASQKRASECNMIVTQPRRISAISLAERIANERNESLGDVIGYQVRLQQVLPRVPGAILFCTTGLLLKKMQSNFDLRGISHVVIDEAHERNIDTDLLLALIKRAMGNNPDLKVIIMSATINAELFQEYLNCKAINVPGRLFPVERFFLEDIEGMGIRGRWQGVDEEGSPIVDYDQVSHLVTYIHESQPEGGILVFLPGWNEIQKVNYSLETSRHADQFEIILLHSKIPYLSQSKVFEPPPEGKRKIILATDIAETGITVPDVVYVVDSALRKEIKWHEGKGLSSIDTERISKANLNQRKGRAGRVRPGFSYHFVYKSDYHHLPLYPVPEVLRMSLEKTVLDAKIYSSQKAEDFFANMPQPPRISAVRKAVNDLQTLGALDNHEDLTDLGKRIALFAIHPRLSKAMVYGTIFQCLYPVTSVSSILSLDNSIFYSILNDRARSRKSKYHFNPSSDHLAMAWMYANWRTIYEQKSPQDAFAFCKKFGLHGERMNILHKVRELNLEHLRESGLVENIDKLRDLESAENKFSTMDELVRGVLLAGMDQILFHRFFEVRKGRVKRSEKGSMVTEDDARAQLTTESVNYKRRNWPSPYLIYYQKTHSEEMRTTLIRESSIISPLTALLFSQGRVTGSEYKEGITEYQNDTMTSLAIEGKKNVQLHCDKNTAQTLLRFRDLMWLVVNYFVSNNVPFNQESRENENNDENDMEAYRTELLKILVETLNDSSRAIDTINDEEFRAKSADHPNEFEEESDEEDEPENVNA